MVIEAGINLYSVHQELGKDYFGTLERIAEAGYTNLELIGFNMVNYTRYMDEIPAESLRDKLKQLGLKAASVHEMSRPDANIEEHNWDAIWTYYDKLNCHAVVLPSVWITDREDTLRMAEQLNRVGKRMRDHGFTFYLHNHAHEFKRIGEDLLFDYLIENTDSAYVRFELDLVWVVRAGLDPLVFLEKLGNRCDIIHQKDISKMTTYPINLFDAMKLDGVHELDNIQSHRKYVLPEDHANLGTGVFDFIGTYEKIKEMGCVRYAVVENEGASPDKISSIASDLQFLNKYL